MNILVIAHFQNDRSSYASFVHDQALSYQALGNKVCVISSVVRLKKESVMYKGLSDKLVDGIKVYYPRRFSLSIYGRYGVNALLGLHAIEKLYKKLLIDFKPDIIHAHTIGFDGAIGVKLKEKFKIPVVITTHGSDTVIPIKDGKASYITNICSNANAIVAVSSKLKKLLIKEEPKLNPYVICNGFNSQFCTEEIKIKHSIIQVSGLIKQKKVDITLKALAEIKKEYNDVTLTIVGEGPEKSYLIDLCYQLDITDSVNFTGQISNKEVLKRMAETEIFVMPSINEGLGIVYLEAMASGCVTVGTKGEGIEDIISNEKNGILVEADHPEMISKYVKRCFSNNVYMKELSSNGRECVRDLTWKTNAEKHIALFEQIIQTYNK